MLEKTITTSILKYLKTVPECFFWKEHGGMYGKRVFQILYAATKGYLLALK